MEATKSGALARWCGQPDENGRRRSLREIGALVGCSRTTVAWYLRETPRASQVYYSMPAKPLGPPVKQATKAARLIREYELEYGSLPACTAAIANGFGINRTTLWRALKEIEA